MGDNRGDEPEIGKLIDYVERKLFQGSIDSLRALITRKKSLANMDRYSILFLLYEQEKIPRSTLVKTTGKDSNGLQHHLRDLLKANLIAEVPTQIEEDSRKSYYRITKLGEQEIKADIRNITGRSPVLGRALTQTGPVADLEESSGSKTENVKIGLEHPDNDLKATSSAG